MMTRVSNFLFYASTGGLVAYLAYREAYGVLIAGLLVGLFSAFYLRKSQ